MSAEPCLACGHEEPHTRTGDYDTHCGYIRNEQIPGNGNGCNHRTYKAWCEESFQRQNFGCWTAQHPCECSAEAREIAQLKKELGDATFAAQRRCIDIVYQLEPDIANRLQELLENEVSK